MRDLLRKFANWMEHKFGGIITVDGTLQVTPRGPIFSDDFKRELYRSYFVQFSEDVPVDDLLLKLTELPVNCTVRGSKEKYWQ